MTGRNDRLIRADEVEPGDTILIIGITSQVNVKSLTPDGPGNLRAITPKGGSLFLRCDEKVELIGRANNVQGTLDFS